MGNAKAPYSVAKANRDEKVRRWKAIGKFKKQQKREEREAAAGNKPVNAIPLPAIGSKLPVFLERSCGSFHPCSSHPRLLPLLLPQLFLSFPVRAPHLAWK